MKKDIFTEHLETLTARVVPFTRRYVVNPLPEKVQYLLYPNRSGVMKHATVKRNRPNIRFRLHFELMPKTLRLTRQRARQNKS